MIDKIEPKVTKLYQKYKSEWKKEINDDLNIDESNLEKKSLSKALVMQKWVNRFLTVGRLSSALKREEEKMLSQLYDHFLFDSDIKYKQSEITTKIKSHDRYQNVMSINDNLKEVLSFLEYAIKHMDSLQWDVKNYIEYKKLLML